MARTSEQISQQIRAGLRVLDPDISTEALTPERKIIDTVAEVMAEASVDEYVLDYIHDIDTKVGVDLDKFIALFGFARQGGRRATGTVTFSRAEAGDVDISIPAGTQVIKPATAVSPAVIFQTTASVTLYRGTLAVDAPVECMSVGEIGNLPGASIIAATSAPGISAVTNAVATTGGTAEETDAELRVRFKNTIFRNIAGTQDQYLALAIASRFTKKANVIGPASRFLEYLQISAGAATSVLPYSKYTYDFDYYLTDGNITDETFYNPAADYTFNDTVPPSITVVNATALPNSKVVLLEHTYTSANSRNDPATNVLNYVDVFVSGADIVSATESAVFPSTAKNVVNSAGNAYHTGNWKRASGANPTVGNRIQELLWQPAAGLPASITIGPSTFVLNTDYWLVTDVTINKGSRRARNAIEWDAQGTPSPALPAAATAFQITYTFDKLPMTLNELMESHKQVTTDVLVHSATERYFNVYLTIMYTPGFSTVSTNTAVITALTAFLERLDFGAVIQVSDILDVVHDVPGVDNVRLTSSTEAPSDYGIQEVAADGVTEIGAAKTNDFALQDSDLPVLNNVFFLPKSQNTWSSL
jgi:uncharacterized phage protein gp47/JayE